MTKKIKVPKPLHDHVRVKRLLNSVKSGQILSLTFVLKQGGGKEAQFHLEPSQRHVATKTARDAISTGLLVPRNDGMFGTSQTWGAD